MVFIVPRQMVYLGDPKRRSCDACESFGAMVKKLIKHSTCRRRLKKETVEHKGSNGRRWKQSFTRGYVQQAFARACVREDLQHGSENAPFLQRADARRRAMGKATRARSKAEREDRLATIREALTALEASGKDATAS